MINLKIQQLYLLFTVAPISWSNQTLYGSGDDEALFNKVWSRFKIENFIDLFQMSNPTRVRVCLHDLSDDSICRIKTTHLQKIPLAEQPHQSMTSEKHFNTHSSVNSSGRATALMTSELYIITQWKGNSTGRAAAPVLRGHHPSISL